MLAGVRRQPEHAQQAAKINPKNAMHVAQVMRAGEAGEIDIAKEYAKKVALGSKRSARPA